MVARRDPHVEELERVNAILKKENAILARALKWYGNKLNWRDDDWGLRKKVTA